MPTRQPHCPRCLNNLFVRSEQVISGRRVEHAHYCGRCDYEWSIASVKPQGEEQRQGDRRKQRVDIATSDLVKAPARVALRAKTDRRRA